MPRHENPRSLADESAICGRVVCHVDAMARSCVDGERADYWLWRNREIVGLLECKRRFIRFNQYPDVMISADKFIACVEAAAVWSVPFLFAVGMDDGTYLYQHFSKAPLCMEYGGRTLNPRPNTKTDREVVVKIPMSLFQKIGDPV